MFMEGIFVQGNVKNAKRVYPVREIAKAVESVQEKIDPVPVLGECDPFQN